MGTHSIIWDSEEIKTQGASLNLEWEESFLFSPGLKGDLVWI